MLFQYAIIANLLVHSSLFLLRLMRATLNSYDSCFLTPHLLLLVHAYYDTIFLFTFIGDTFRDVV